MPDWFGVFFGLFLFLGGALSVLDHPVVDAFNRFVKSAGTTQRAHQVEMSDISVATGRVVGAFVAVLGLGIVGASL